MSMQVQLHGVGGVDASLLLQIEDAYLAARARPDAPFAMLDALHRQSIGKHRALLQQSPTPAALEQDRQQLQQALALFVEWRDMPAAQMSSALFRLQHPPALPLDPMQAARNHIAAMEGQGLRFELQGGTFAVSPAAKLSGADKAALTECKPHILAELVRRADAWSP